MPGRAGRVIKRAHKAGFMFEQLENLLLIPEMVATCDSIDSRGKDLFRGSRCDSRASRGVFAIGHNQIEGMFLAQPGDQFAHGSAAGLTDDITDKEQLHGPTVMSQAA